VLSLLSVYRCDKHCEFANCSVRKTWLGRPRMLPRWSVAASFAMYVTCGHRENDPCQTHCGVLTYH
jgi:Fe-S-cluster-containing hydrogenase component 2